jgi:hypothetical protein
MPIGFETGKAVLALNPKSALGFTSAANPEVLPKPEPWAMREHFVVPPIRSRDGACTQRPNIRLQPLRNSSRLRQHDISGILIITEPEKYRVP